MSKNNNILIVGAGSVGIVAGYHLSLSGESVSYFVRPKRMEELKPPLQLYCYDDCQTKEFNSYRLLCDMDRVAEENYDYVILTLDGASIMADEGKQLLRSLGEAIHDKNTGLICYSVAAGIDNFVTEHSGLPIERVATGSFVMVAHPNPVEQMVVGSGVNETELLASYQAYSHVIGTTAVLLGNRNKALAKQFAEVYGRNKLHTCMILPQRLVDTFFNALFPLMAGFELAGWPSTKEMIRNREIWPLACKASNEIAALPQFGMTGKFISRVMSPYLYGRLWSRLGKGALPADYDGFSRYHHGGKVVAQDTKVMRDNLKSGTELGRAMPCLRRLLSELDRCRSTTVPDN